MLSFMLLAATAAVADPAQINTCKAPNLNPATLVHLQMNPTPNQEPVVTSDPSIPSVTLSGSVEMASGGNGGAPYGYTRLRILYSACQAVQRTYDPERRPSIRRYFFGKNAAKVLKLKASVDPLGVDATNTLASIGRKSGKQGEEWTTDVENDAILLPYFRIDNSSVVKLEVSFDSNRDYNTSVAGSALDIIKRAGALISPTSALITTVNKARFNDAASFVDTAIDGLLKVSISEKARLDATLKPGNKPQILAVITLSAPGANDAYPTKFFPNAPIGQWTIIADRVRPSMLGVAQSETSLAPGSYTTAAVMNFYVSDDKTLREALAGSSSVTTARDALIKATVAGATDAGRSFCRVVASESDSLGLAPLDVGAAVWAALNDLALADDKARTARAGCAGIEYFPVDPPTR